jgi:hypothetical protein
LWPLRYLSLISMTPEVVRRVLEGLSQSTMRHSIAKLSFELEGWAHELTLLNDFRGIFTVLQSFSRLEIMVIYLDYTGTMRSFTHSQSE